MRKPKGLLKISLEFPTRRHQRKPEELSRFPSLSPSKGTPAKTQGILNSL